MRRAIVNTTVLLPFSASGPAYSGNDVFEKTWHWECMSKSDGFCRGNDEFIVQEGTLYCSHSIVDKSVNPPDSPVEVKAIPGGIHAERFVGHTIFTNQRAWFDSMVTVTTVSPNAPEEVKKTCKSSDRLDPKLVYRTFCLKDGPATGWVAIWRTDDSKCPKSSEFGRNALNAFLAESAPSGYETEICADQDVPQGWEDKGLIDDKGHICVSADGSGHNRLRRVRRP